MIRSLRELVLEQIVLNYQAGGVWMQDLPILLQSSIQYEGLYKLGFVNLTEFIQENLGDKLRISVEPNN